MRHGFSLVELSIVLVILGLLTGGILAGQSLIRAAELRGSLTELDRYKSALHTFRDKYMAIPGDMTNATSFWGSAGGTGSIADISCYSVPSTTTTCNGDGNGRISEPSGSAWNEQWRAWQQLANAGLIEGSYPGVQGSYAGGSVANVPRLNVPATKLNSTAYWILLNLNNAASTQYFAGTRWGNYLSNGGPLATSLDPTEAWNLDKKIDDAAPATGSVTAYKGNGSTTYCTSNAGTLADSVSATYRLDITSRDCYLYFPNVI